MPDTDDLIHAALAALAEDRLDDAVETAARARASAPSNAAARLAEARALRAVRRLDEAAEAVAEARRLAPDDTAVTHTMALIELSRGNWENGWRLFEVRLAMPQRREFRFSHRAPPMWRGQDLSGHSLLLRWEGGIDDTIQMLRYVEPLTCTGCTLFLDVQKPLLPLAETLPGVAGITASDSDDPVFGHADFFLPMLSLPRHADDHLARPCPPYLTADPRRVAGWKTRLAALPRPWRVVQWQGSSVAGSQPDHARSVPAETFVAAFAGLSGSLISLDPDTRCPAGTVDLSAEADDFADHAAILTLADHVVTVDGELAHLAGALGVAAQVLVAVNADWRWLAPNSGNLYPSLVPHHQERPGGWDTPLADAVTARKRDA